MWIGLLKLAVFFYFYFWRKPRVGAQTKTTPFISLTKLETRFHLSTPSRPLLIVSSVYFFLPMTSGVSIGAEGLWGSITLHWLNYMYQSLDFFSLQTMWSVKLWILYANVWVPCLQIHRPVTEHTKTSKQTPFTLSITVALKRGLKTRYIIGVFKHCV